MNDITQSYGSAINTAPPTTRTGYMFSGWYSDSALTNPVNFPYTVPNLNVTLYAKWTANSYAVSFNTNGGSEVDRITQNYGTTIEQTPATARVGYSFGGWYSDPVLASAVTFPYTVTQDSILYAKWTPAAYTIDFNTNGGSPIDSITQDYGTTITTAPITTRAGCTFNGWYSDSALTNPVNFPYTVSDHNATLYAKWTANTYTVGFNTNGGTLVGSVKTNEGSLLNAPPDPDRDGYLFEGWYKDSGYENKWDFAADRVTSDTTLYAKWQLAYTVTFNSRGGSTMANLTTPPHVSIHAPVWGATGTRHAKL